MKHLKYAVFCNTPYQLMAGIALTAKEAPETDIYITSQSKGNRDIAEKLKALELFHDVIYIDTRKKNLEIPRGNGLLSVWIDFISLLQYMNNMLFLDRTVSNYYHTDRDYEYIAVTSNAMAGRFAILYNIKHETAAGYIEFDDGIESYINVDFVRCPRLYDRIVRRVLLGKKAVYINYEKKLFDPGFFYGINSTGQHADCIPKIVNNGYWNRIISKIFTDAESVRFEERLLILDFIPEDNLYQPGVALYKNTLNMIVETVGQENTIFKKHPRDKKADTGNTKMLPSAIPFEAIVYWNDCSNKVLVTRSSTAAFTPKLLFDQEPMVLILYGLTEKYNKVHNEFFSKYVKGLKEIYRNPGKILYPQNKEELMAYLEKIKCTE